ncbi:hypothetical protein ACFLU6_04620 [Acidobacteriota bacterium]
MQQNQETSQGPTLKSVEEQFRQWRETRTRRRPIPEELWKAAVPLIGEYSVNQVSRALRLNYTALKKRATEGAENKEGSVSVKNSRFVELDVNVVMNNGMNWTVEMENTEGAKMKITYQGSKGDDLLHIARVFFEKVRSACMRHSHFNAATTARTSMNYEKTTRCWQGSIRTIR